MLANMFRGVVSLVTSPRPFGQPWASPRMRWKDRAAGLRQPAATFRAVCRWMVRANQDAPSGRVRQENTSDSICGGHPSRGGPGHITQCQRPARNGLIPTNRAARTMAKRRRTAGASVRGPMIRGCGARTPRPYRGKTQTLWLVPARRCEPGQSAGRPYFPRGELGSLATKQAAGWGSPSSGGGDCVQRGSTQGQRSANEQPGYSRSGEGTSPVSTWRRRCCSLTGSGIGTAESSACV